MTMMNRDDMDAYAGSADEEDDIQGSYDGVAEEVESESGWDLEDVLTWTGSKIYAAADWVGGVTSRLFGSKDEL